MHVSYYYHEVQTRVGMIRDCKHFVKRLVLLLKNQLISTKRVEIIYSLILSKYAKHAVFLLDGLLCFRYTFMLRPSGGMADAAVSKTVV